MKSEPNRGTVLITGASSGLGAEYARQFAAQGYGLVLTARRADRLAEVAESLGQRHGIQVSVVPGDLTDRAFVDEMETLIRDMDGLVVLVNNAGFGVSGPYAEQPIARHQRMIDVHITAAVRLTHAALPGMIRRGKGFIVNVSSIAAFIPAGSPPGYTASKAYLNAFSLNLDSLVRHKGVRIQALCPGYTRTGFHSSDQYQGTERETFPDWVWMSSEDVVACSLRKLTSRKVIVIPGFKYQLIAVLLRSRIGTSLMGLRRLMFGK
jgi:short-subunit dehydrogenase